MATLPENLARLEAAKALLRGRFGLEVCGNGLVTGHCSTARKCSEVDPHEFWRLAAVDAKRLFVKTKTYNRKWSSYGYKRVVEHACEFPYWSNGAFILYMVHAGFEVMPMGMASTSVYLKCRLAKSQPASQ